MLGQLGNRVQHALRSFTPKDQKAVKVAAQTFRQNPKLDTAKMIMQLGVGEALVSLLDASGTPAMVEKVSVYPPASRIGPISLQERQGIMSQSPFAGVYEKTIDRESAYEILNKKIAVKAESVEKESGEEIVKRPPGRPRDTLVQTVVKTTTRTLASTIGQQIVRGLLGSIFGKK